MSFFFSFIEGLLLKNKYLKMKIYSAILIGDYHPNHCEDYLYIGEFGKDKIICAVMDGCTITNSINTTIYN